MSEKYLVRHFMTAPVKSIQRDATLLDAVLLLRSTGFRHLPIVDGDRLVGIISERDLYRVAPSLLVNMAAVEYNAVFENTPLDRVMTRNPVTVTPTTPLREAATILHKQKLGCLPVVENGHLVGILTVTDLLAVLVRFLVRASRESPVGSH